MTYQKHIPGPTPNVFVFRIINFGAIAKLITVLVGSVRFFVVQRE